MTELPGVGRKRFDVAALTLSVQSVKSQRRFSRTGQASYYDEFVARYGEINVFRLWVRAPLTTILSIGLPRVRVKPAIMRLCYESKAEMDFNPLD